MANTQMLAGLRQAVELLDATPDTPRITSVEVLGYGDHEISITITHLSSDEHTVARFAAVLGLTDRGDRGRDANQVWWRGRVEGQAVRVSWVGPRPDEAVEEI